MKKIVAVLFIWTWALAVNALTTNSAGLVQYQSFYGNNYLLKPWFGSNVCVLASTTNQFNPTVMSNILAALDKAWSFYAAATGHQPNSWDPTTLYGRDTIAEVTNTCGAGCSYIGFTGTEILIPYFDILYNGVASANQYDQVLFYEFGRNFWFYGNQLAYLNPDNDPVTTGFAVYMRFLSMDAAGVAGGPFGGYSFETFRTSVTNLIDLYITNSALNWSNTFRVGHAPPNPLNLGTTDLIASLLMRIGRDFGSPTFGLDFWEQVELRPTAATTQAAVDNFVLAACATVNLNLTRVFSVDWKFPVSTIASQEAQTRWGEPVGTNQVSKLNIVPWPQNVVLQAGTFPLSSNTRIVPAAPALQPLAAVLSSEFQLAFNLGLAVNSNAPSVDNILLRLSGALTGEAYSVTVTAAGAIVEAGNYGALAAGSVSLLQAVSFDGTNASIPCLTITDAPFAPYRGLMIDCARQPHSVGTLEKIIELCRLYKVRYLQLHLTDDQGFMFPTTNFPLLTSQNWSGAAFSLNDLRTLESYSQARGVTIIPELEIPGHEAAMIRTMPDLFKITGTVPYEHHATLNWAKAEVMNALDLLIGEMCGVFQATPYFHIGGDEADYAYAHQNTNFIQQFQALGYPQPYDSGDTYQLYRRLLRNLSQLISTKYGKQMLCWEGFYEDNSPSPLEPVPKTIPVMAFENAYYPADLLVQDGYPVINTAWNPLYVVNGTVCSPEHIYGWNMYQFGKYQTNWDQVVWITVPTNSPLVIGAQMCAWEQADSVEMPSLRLRVPAMSERIWNPGAGKTYTDFSNRVAVTDVLLTAVTAVFPLTANAGSPKVVNPSAPAIAIGGSPTASGGVAPYTYNWTPSTGLSSSTVANPTASPTVTTTYTVTVTDSLGTTGTSSVAVIRLAAAADYGSYIAGTTPVGWWGMNETSAATTTADLSGTYGATHNGAGANLPLSYQGPGANSLPGQAGIVNGVTNRAAYFDGTSASGLFGNSASAYANPTGTGTIYYYPSGFAIEAWVKCDGLLATDCERLISTREFGLGFEANNGNSFGRIQFTTFAIKDYFSTNTMPADGRWHQIGISWDGTTGTTAFYTDGVSAGTMIGPTGLVGASSSGANSVNLTHRTADAQHFKGWVDEVVLWNHTRSALDFATTYAVATQPVPPPAFPASGYSRPDGVPTFDIPNTVAGSIYTLVYKNMLTDSAWTALGGQGTGVGNGGTLRLSDPTVVGLLPATRYYRLQRNP